MKEEETIANAVKQLGKVNTELRKVVEHQLRLIEVLDVLEIQLRKLEEKFKSKK